MKLLQGVLLGNGALFLLGLLGGLPVTQLILPPVVFTLGVMGLASAALLLGEALIWKRKVFPGQATLVPALESAGDYRKETENNGNFPVEVVGLPVAEPLVNRGKLVETLARMVQNHYDNRAVSRNSMTGTGQTTQPYWQLAQAVLVKLGIRVEGQPSEWQGTGTSTGDLKLLASRVAITAAEVKVLTPVGWELVDLQGCHFL